MHVRADELGIELAGRAQLSAWAPHTCSGAKSAPPPTRRLELALPQSLKAPSLPAAWVCMCVYCMQSRRPLRESS